jgi:hypothetical protein
MGRRQLGGLLIGAVVLVMLVGGIWLYTSFYQGRDLSRWTGIPVKVALPDCVRGPDQIISVSFHSKSSGETVKDVTYVCDGRIYSHEYNDFGILQGTIEWTYNR